MFLFKSQLFWSLYTLFSINKFGSVVIFLYARKGLLFGFFTLGLWLPGCPNQGYRQQLLQLSTNRKLHSNFLKLFFQRNNNIFL